MKRIVSALLAMLLLFSATAYGENVQSTASQAAENTETKEEKEEKKEPEKKKKMAAQSPYAVLADLKTGNIIYKKNAEKRVYPASLTKIMTAVIVLENSKMEEIVTVTEAATANVKAGDSKAGLVKGERLSVRQLLYAMLLASAADATNALAEHIDGSIEKFVVHMNEYSQKLEMKNTSFTNPTGDHDDRHYTTALDMTKLVCYAMKNDDFREIVRCTSYNIPATEKYKSERVIANKNYFVSPYIKRDYFYKYATGIKTGYTKEAKSCIAASARKNNTELACVIFGAKTVDGETQSFTDCQRLFDFVFENYSEHTVVKADAIVTQTNVENTRRTKKMLLKTADGIIALKNKNEKKAEITFKDNVKKSVKAPVKAGEKVGTREYFLNGASVGTVALVADKDYKFDLITFIVNKTVAFFTSPWLFAAIAAAIIVFVFWQRRKRRILRKKRRDARRRRNTEIEKMVKNIH